MKAAPLARAAFDLDAAAVRGHDPPALAKAHADAAAGLPSRIKRLEDVLPLLGRDAWSVVGDRDPNFAAARAEGDFDPAAGDERLQGVLAQGAKRDRELDGIGGDKQTV